MPIDKPENQHESEQGLPASVAEFLRDVIQSSPMRFDILRFFYQNPYAILTISDLSVWMSREEKPLTDALQQLTRLGYLTQSYASSAYVLTSDWEKRQQLDNFFGYLEDNPELVQKIRRSIHPGTEVE